MRSARTIAAKAANPTRATAHRAGFVAKQLWPCVVSATARRGHSPRIPAEAAGPTSRRQEVLLDPITLGFILTAAISGFIGNRADHLVCSQTSRVWQAIRDGQTQPRNGDLALAIRRAQLLALKLGVKAYADLPHPHWRTFPGYSAEDIATPLLTWIDRALAKGEAAAIDPDRMRAVEDQIERVFTHPAPHGGAAGQRQDELRELAVGWTLAEAQAFVPNAKDWPRFAGLIRGEDAANGYPGWWPLFRAFMAEEVKRNDRVQAILAEQGIAALLELQTDLADAMTALQVGLEIAFDEMRPALDELRAASRDIAANGARIEAALTRLEPAFAGILDARLRSWHGINPATGQTEPWPERVRDRPAELLIARYRVVPFLDRGGLRAELLAWATATTARRAAGRLYVAPGGFGKTRLGIELIQELGQRGWRCSFLSQSNAEFLTAGSLADLLRANGHQGVCVVVDYAESQFERLRTLANAAHSAEAVGPPIRLVIFARSAEGWWNDFAGDPAPAAIFAPAPIPAVATPLSAEERADLFDRSRQAFVNRLRNLDLPTQSEAPARPDLAQADRPLTIAALAFLAARGVDPGGRSIVQTLYEEERRNWRRILGGLAPDAPEVTDLARAATQVTLVQGATQDGATALIEADSNGRVLPPPRVLAALRRLYGRQGEIPGATPEGATPAVFISAIEPDLLGEHAAMAVLAAHGTAPLIASLRTALNGHPLSAQDPALILTVLIRATHPDHDPAIRRSAETGIAAIEAIVPTLMEQHAEDFAASLPEFSVALRRLALALHERLLDFAPSGSTVAAQTKRARRLNNLGNSLSDLGRREAALAASEEAVTLRRELVKANRDAFLPDLVLALGGRGQVLLAAERPAEATSAFQEAATLLRPLATEHPAAFGDRFQALLRDMVQALRAAGRDDAIAAALADLGVGAAPSETGPSAAFGEAVRLFNAWIEAHHAAVESGTTEAIAAAEAARDALDTYLAAQADDDSLAPIRQARDDALRQLRGDGDAPPAA